MRALGIALTVCGVAVLYPSTARADSIRAQTDPAMSVQQSDGVDRSDDDDATFRNRSGFERSLQFANLGFADVFADDRTSFCDNREFKGFGPELKNHITVALRKHGGRGHGRDGKGKDKKDWKRDEVGGSPNPEPASVLLIATGVAGLFLYRRQLLA